MKKWTLWIAALLLGMMASFALADVPAKPSEFSYVYDFSGNTMSSRDEETIMAYGEALEEATGIQAVAVVVDFLGGEDPADYATDLINEWGIGDKHEDNGVVVLLARGDRRIQIGTGSGIDRVLTGSKSGDLIDRNLDDFAANRFSSGMASLYTDVCEFLAKAEGKRLNLSGTSANTYYDDEDIYVSDRRSRTSMFDVLLSLLFTYIVVSVLVNAFMPRNGCLRMFFLGWLFDRSGSGRYRDHNRGNYRTYGGSRRSSGRSSFGGGSSRGRSSGGRSFGGGSSSRSSRSFGGGSSRGGGGGRSF